MEVLTWWWREKLKAVCDGLVPETQALERLKQEDHHELEASLDYIVRLQPIVGQNSVLNVNDIYIQKIQILGKQKEKKKN